MSVSPPRYRRLFSIYKTHPFVLSRRRAPGVLGPARRRGPRGHDRHVPGSPRHELGIAHPQRPAAEI